MSSSCSLRPAFTKEIVEEIRGFWPLHPRVDVLDLIIFEISRKP